MILLPLLLACSSPPEAPMTAPDPLAELATPRAGVWHAWLDSPGGPLPFGLELTQGTNGWTAVIQNGIERIEIDEVVVDSTSVTLRIPHYQAELEASLADRGERLKGTWTKVKPNDTTDTLPFHATFGPAPRFEPLRVLGEPSPVGGRWAVDFDSEDLMSVGIFDQLGTLATGTFLTPLGDYRYLAGSIEGNQLRLSTFDGAHAFLFTATMDPKGALNGDFWSGSKWHETWTATRDDDVTLPDALALTRVDERVDWSAVSFPDLDGRPRTLADPAWSESPRLVQIMGTWCPNCNDQTDLLVELDRTYSARGLQIVSVAFEHSADPKRNASVVQRYKDHHGATWTYLVGGLSNKEQASQSLPFLDRVRSYPTLLFVDRTGVVQATWTGFSGPAAPREHAELRATFEREVEAILK